MKKTEIKKAYCVKLYERHADKLRRAGQKLSRSKGKLNLSGGVEIAAELLPDEVKK